MTIVVADTSAIPVAPLARSRPFRLLTDETEAAKLRATRISPQASESSLRVAAGSHFGNVERWEEMPPLLAEAWDEDLPGNSGQAKNKKERLVKRRGSHSQPRQQ